MSSIINFILQLIGYTFCAALLLIVSYAIIAVCKEDEKKSGLACLIVGCIIMFLVNDYNTRTEKEQDALYKVFSNISNIASDMYDLEKDIYLDINNSGFYIVDDIELLSEDYYDNHVYKLDEFISEYIRYENYAEQIFFEIENYE